MSKFFSLFTLTKNIVKWQFEKILSQVPSSAYIIDKNKSVTRMWCIIHAVQTVETYLGFSISVRRSGRKRNPNDSVLLSTWCSFRQKCLVVILPSGILNTTIISNFCWAIYQCPSSASEGSFRTTEQRLMLPPKQIYMFLSNSKLFRRRTTATFFPCMPFSNFGVFSYCKVTAFML